MAKVGKEKLKTIKKLYYQDGLSMREVGDRIRVPLGAVLYFMRKYNLPRRSFSEDNKIRFSRKKPSFILKKNLSSKEQVLKIAGILLYWAEGSKWHGEQIVDFANSDPDMVRIFLNFLREICGVKESKLKAYIYCYSNQNIKNLIDFWSSLINIPKNQFTKPYIRKDYKKEKSGKMKWGLIHIRYCDKKLLLLFRKWIVDYSKILGR